MMKSAEIQAKLKETEIQFEGILARKAVLLQEIEKLKERVRRTDSALSQLGIELYTGKLLLEDALKEESGYYDRN